MIEILYTLAFCSGGSDLTCMYNKINSQRIVKHCIENCQVKKVNGARLRSDVLD
jgi:hypothetical protein